MKKYRQAAASIAFLTVILTAGIYSGNPIITPIQGNDSSARDQQEDILDTFEAGDYQKWKKLVSRKGEISKIITEAEFNEFIQARKAARSGNYDEAIAMAEKIESNLKDKISSRYFS